MEILANSEILKSFEGKRQEFKPYGLTCEKWVPMTMARFDRHNEIELNFVPEGEVCYMFHDRPVVVPQRCLTVFWGLIPHKVMVTDNTRSYYVATIPLSLFLNWELPGDFVTNLLNGACLIDSGCDSFEYDSYLFGKWHSDIQDLQKLRLVALEMHGRLLRLASRYDSCVTDVSLDSGNISQIERIAIYIAQNYKKTIRMSDVGNAVGLNSDYANSLSRKAFGHTISEHLVMERITHAQRKLISSSDSIFKISLDCGFNSISSFNIAFRKINNCTPSEYRKRHRIEALISEI